jgi:ribosomal protein S18 acetylase RimI-like enzyme
MNTNNNNEINIRRMMRNDIDAVLALDRKIGGGKGTINYRDLVEIDPGGPLDFSCVCESKGIMIGFILVRISYFGIPLTATCVINSIATDPDYEKHGIGSALVNNLLDRCYAEGVPKARAPIDETNADLLRFYQRLSFKRTNIVDYDFEVVSDYLTSKMALDNRK